MSHSDCLWSNIVANFHGRFNRLFTIVKSQLFCFLFENLNRKYNIYNLTNTDIKDLPATHRQHNLKSF